MTNERKQKVKERHIRQLRKVGLKRLPAKWRDEGTLPKSFLPLRVRITVVSVAVVVYGGWVFGSMVVAESDFFSALELGIVVFDGDSEFSHK